MCQLLETIKVKQNALLHLKFHNIRVNYSRRNLFQSDDSWDLSQLITIPELDPNKVYRCRFLYSHTVEKIEFLPYVPRIIKKLFLVTADDIDYSFKYADRDVLEKLKISRATEQDSDLLIVKNGLITDTSFTNIAFFDGNKWFTPDFPLLKGTKRAYYISNGMLTEKRITPADLPGYQKARLINAMLDMEDGQDIPVENIVMSSDTQFIISKLKY
jgi:4-amino-4-deoxychorismate lyase